MDGTGICHNNCTIIKLIKVIPDMSAESNRPLEYYYYYSKQNNLSYSKSIYSYYGTELCQLVRTYVKFHCLHTCRANTLIEISTSLQPQKANPPN